MKDRSNERVLRLIPINPFTPRQRQVIELLARGLQYKEIGTKLNISSKTVRNIVHGTDSANGVLGIIEELTQFRPGNKVELINTLIGDVLFWKSQEKNDIN